MPLKEINKIKDLMELGGLSKDEFFYVDFRVSSKCNYSCWYCKDMHNNKIKNTHFDLELLRNFIRALNRKCSFFLYGGEPTIHPQFIDIVKVISETSCPESRVEIQTNMSIKDEDIHKLINIEKVKILASYHHLNCDTKDFMLKCLKSKSILKQITVMYQRDVSESVLEAFKKIDMVFGKSCNVELMPLLCGSIEEDEEQPYREIEGFYADKKALEISNSKGYGGATLKGKLSSGEEFETSPNELWYKKQNCFKGMLCNVSKERIIIDSDGSCYKCFNEIFDGSIKPKYNITIKDRSPEEYLKNLQHMECPYEKCFFEFNHKKFLKKN